MMADRNSYDRSSAEIPTSPTAPGPSVEAAVESHEATRETDPTYDHVIQSDVRNHLKGEIIHLTENR